MDFLCVLGGLCSWFMFIVGCVDGSCVFSGLRVSFMFILFVVCEVHVYWVDCGSRSV